MRPSPLALATEEEGLMGPGGNIGVMGAEADDGAWPDACILDMRDGMFKGGTLRVVILFIVDPALGSCAEGVTWPLTAEENSGLRTCND